MPKEKDGPVQGQNPQPPKKDKKKIEGQKSAASLPVHAPYYLDAIIRYSCLSSKNQKKSVNRFNKQGEKITDCHQVVWWRPQPLRMYFYKNLIIIERYMSIEGKTPSLRSCYRAITTITLSRT